MTKIFYLDSSFVMNGYEKLDLESHQLCITGKKGGTILPTCLPKRNMY